MTLADMLLEKERVRKEKVKSLLVKAFKRAQLDYAEATCWKVKDHRMLMVAGKIIDREWWNRIIISYLRLYAQKLIEKGDIGIC